MSSPLDTASAILNRWFLTFGGQNALEEGIAAELRAAEERGRRSVRGGVEEHDLKVWPEFFDALADGSKSFDLPERHDRDFQVGDRLRLREFVPAAPGDPTDDVRYTGRALVREVSYVLDLAEVCGRAVAPGFVVLGLRDLDAPLGEKAPRLVASALDVLGTLPANPLLERAGSLLRGALRELGWPRR